MATAEFTAYIARSGMWDSCCLLAIKRYDESPMFITIAGSAAADASDDNGAVLMEAALRVRIGY